MLFIDDVTNVPYAAQGQTLRPVTSGAKKLAAAPWLTGLTFLVIPTDPLEETDRGGAGTYARFSLRSLGGPITDLARDDQIQITTGEYAGTYEITGIAQRGGDHTQIVVKLTLGT